MCALQRCIVCVLCGPCAQDLGEFLKLHKARIVASLPCYSAENVDKQVGGHPSSPPFFPISPCVLCPVWCILHPLPVGTQGYFLYSVSLRSVAAVCLTRASEPCSSSTH